MLGLASTGVHSNGFSLVRRIVEASGAGWATPFAGGETLGTVLLTPTRIYVRSLLRLHRAGLLKAAAHITGGGLPGNLPRVLPPATRAVLQADAWTPPPIFAWLARAGGVATEEMLRVFNCGIGMTVITADPTRAREILEAEGETTFEIGRIEAAAAGCAPEVEVNFTGSWLA